MSVTGVVAEFNPFHNGHKYLLNNLKKSGDSVVCVIGDDFTQRGDVAIVSKYERAKMALLNGADICILLPTPWSMSCANTFSLGGMSILNSLSVVEKVAFGSECGNIDTLTEVSKIIHSEEISPIIEEELKSGKTFASARQCAINKIIGEKAEILSNSNDNLATEYIYNAEKIGFKPKFTALTRVGGLHDSKEAQNEFLSASAIREHVINKNADEIKKYMPSSAYDILNKAIDDGDFAELKNLESSILSHLRRLSVNDLKALPEVSEGLENRIFDAVKTSVTLSDCFEKIKTKRYTLARIRRIILSAYLGLDSSFLSSPVPYIKVLGFNKTGEEILKNANPTVPLILRGADYGKLDGFAKSTFEVQNRASDLYALAKNKKSPCGSEFTARLIKM
ncbi:MAG: nucleotidyltransferase family protein [Acutalibacteraceae bacterium]|nr:nucleotidyltransferase family protein [Acutalibacteraceae bacterium]